jgi:predicted esterase
MKPRERPGDLRFGAPLARARGAVLLVHGRGSSPEDIAGLATELTEPGLAFFAPAAAGGAWYPERFLVPVERNEPWLGGALGTIAGLVEEIGKAGLPARQIGLVGFSQGACLVLEYAARHPRRYGFVAGLSGALIGPLGAARPPGDLKATPILVACAESDAHIPLDYVERSAETLGHLGADVTKQIYRGDEHTVFPEEIHWLQQRRLAP